LDALRWGLIPYWAKDPKIAYKTINARAETVETAPSYREAFKKRRCLIPADGFYEWRTIGGTKIPFAIGMKDDRPFAFAGLWEGWKENGAKIRIAFVEDGGELHAFYYGVLLGMDKPWAGVSWLLARNG
jgi:putative SOS response-associated peptidase YedK